MRINIGIKDIVERLEIPRATVARGMKRLIDSEQVTRLYMGC
jgi:predicted transcriptional regulator